MFHTGRDNANFSSVGSVSKFHHFVSMIMSKVCDRLRPHTEDFCEKSYVCKWDGPDDPDLGVCSTVIK